MLGTVLVTAYFVIAVTLYLRHKQRSSPKGGIQGRIMSIQRADTVRIISLSIGKLSRPLRFEPGQFGYLRIMDSALPSEEHPFSFSSASRDGFRMTIKAVGDYTSDLYEKCAPGTPVRITGPYGRFVYKPDGRGKSLFIAGGVGVTPFLSIIDTLKEQSLETPVHLLWLCSMETDFFDREEVEDAVQRLPLFDADFVIDKKGESISVNRLKTLAGNPQTCELFVCAPPPLMKHVRRCALSAGIGRRRIHHEAFSF